MEVGTSRESANYSPVLLCDTVCRCCVGWKHERGLPWKHPGSANEQLPHLSPDGMAHEHGHHFRHLVHHSYADKPVAVHVFCSIVYDHQHWVQRPDIAFIYVSSPRCLLGAVQFNQHKPDDQRHLYIRFGSWLKFHTKCWLFNQHLLERHCLPIHQWPRSYWPYGSSWLPRMAGKPRTTGVDWLPGTSG